MAIEVVEWVEGQVVNGVIVLDDNSRLPEGARVQMVVIDSPKEEARPDQPFIVE
jgi:hypothetical protein